MSFGNTFIYCLIDPITHDVRYIGKADNPYERLRRHFNDKCHSHKTHWLGSLFRKGLKPEWTILEKCDSAVWQEREMYWIAFGRKIGWPLTNLTDGGDGLKNPSVEIRRKISDIVKKRFVSEEERKKQGRPGRVSNRKGVCLSEETRKKISESNLNRVVPDEVRRKMSIARIGKHLSEETKKRISNANKGQIVTEEKRKRLRELFTGVRRSEDTRRKISEANRGRVLSEESRKKISDTLKNRGRRGVGL